MRRFDSETKGFLTSAHPWYPNSKRLWRIVWALEVLSSNSLNFSVILSTDCCLSFLSIWTRCHLSRSLRIGGLSGWGAGDTNSSSFHFLITSFIVILGISKILKISVGLWWPLWSPMISFRSKMLNQTHRKAQSGDCRAFSRQRKLCPYKVCQYSMEKPW